MASTFPKTYRKKRYNHPHHKRSRPACQQGLYVHCVRVCSTTRVLRMQVGDIILEINGELVEGKTTKEVVTSLMRSPDDLILKVKEDAETKSRVLKFLEPLENPPGSNPKIRVKTIGHASPKHKQQKIKESSPVRPGSTQPSPPATPNGQTDDSRPENGQSSVSLESTKLDSSSGELGDVDVKQCKSGGVIIVETPDSDLPSPVKTNNIHPSDHRLTGGAPINGIGRDQLRDRDMPSARQVYAANAYSFSSDSSVSDIPSVQVMTTVAQIHREDSSLIARTLPDQEMTDVMDGQLHSSPNCKHADQESDLRHNDINRNVSKMPMVSLAESESSQSELSSQASSCPSEGPLADSPLRTHRLAAASKHPTGKDAAERATQVDLSLAGEKETDSVTYDSGYASTSSVAKQCSNFSHSQSSQTNLDADASKSMENPPDEQQPTEPRQATTLVHHGSDAMEPWTGGMGSRTSSDHSVNSEESECLDMDSLGNALQAGSKNLDVPSAQRLAKRLFMLDGFKRSDVAKHLSKRNDFSKLVAEEYVTYFDFTNLPLDIALRKFLAKIAVSGETQERERVLLHFSTRYQQCNEIEFRSVDAVNALTCALMLLNTDLHGQNIAKKMSLSAFISNLERMNEGEDFSREMLKTFYQSIKSKPLEWACDEEEKLLKRGSRTGNGTMTVGSNPFLEVQNDPNAPVYIKGYIMRKVTRDAEGKKNPKGKRAWKMFYATVKGLILYLHKSEMHHQMHFNTPKEAVSIHHSLSSKVSNYSKRPNVFNLRLANWREFFIQCLDSQDLQNWMQALNLAAAVHSAPPLPAAVGLQKTFRRPLLPSSPSKLNTQEQLGSHERKVESIEQELEDHRSYPPDQGQRASVMKDYQTKQEYLEYELSRFKTYIYLLRSQLVAQQTTAIGKYTLEEVMPQPTQSMDSMSSTSSVSSLEGSQGSGQPQQPQNKNPIMHHSKKFKDQTFVFENVSQMYYDSDDANSCHDSTDDTDEEDEEEDDIDEETGCQAEDDFVMVPSPLPLNQFDEMTKL
ncbi:PH and SEC7 domain-containing protein 2-like isoform X3 [Acanthaster planci]|uniref:PH and SEC7 domain-containing protein 2-like isoform X3 n=1 Tax=Acanthaster planci TaxID=133434 RepID=A0A8B7ZT60_ACAPL|nr:PH and SEC7 domain-containing protein 2-like isoform X3 [Acanthaster planci]